MMYIVNVNFVQHVSKAATLAKNQPIVDIKVCQTHTLRNQYCDN